MLKVHSIETFGTHDGPGIRLVIFVQGCMFKCLYCHNPDTIPLVGGKEMSVDELVKIVENEKVYFGKDGGVTVSGGECLLQAKELIPFFKKLNKLGIHTALDTNGFILNDDVKELLKYTDLTIPDIKHMDSDFHRKLTGQPNEPVLKFIEYLDETGEKFRVRHVLVPGWTNDSKHLNKLGKYISQLKNMERFEILPYNILGIHKRKALGWKYELEGVNYPTEKELEKARKILSKYTDNLVIRGI